MLFRSGLQTAVDFLKTKSSLGEIKDDANVNTKITDEQYEALVKEFKGDKDVKTQAGMIFPKKKDKEKPKKELKPEVEEVKEEPRQTFTPLGKIDLSMVGKPAKPKEEQKKPEPVAPKVEPVQEVKQEEPKPEPKPESKPEPVPVVEQPKEEEPEPVPVAEEPEVFKLTLPTAISGVSLRADIKLTKNSGIDVPQATMVSPMTISGTPKRRANELAPSVRRSAPTSTNVTPIIIYRTSRITS